MDNTNQIRVKTNRCLTSKDEVQFFLGFYLYIISWLIGMTVVGSGSVIEGVLRMMRIVSYLLFAHLIINRLVTNRRFLLFYIFSAIITIISASISHEKRFIFFVLIIGAAYGIKSRVLLKTYFFVQLFFLFSIVILSRIGVIRDYIWDASTRNRHMLGFTWTTTAPILFLYLTFVFIAIKKGKINLVESIVIAIMAYWLFFMTNTRFAFIMNLFVDVFFLIIGGRIDKNEYKNKLLCGFFVVSPQIICFGTILLYRIYNPDNAIMLQINSLLSNRLNLGMTAINKYGFPLLGTAVRWRGWSIYTDNSEVYNYVDSSYLQIGIQHGFLLLSAVLLLFSIIIYFSIKKQQIYMCWVIVFILLFSINEPQLMNLSFNVFPLLVASDWCLNGSICGDKEKSFIKESMRNE